MSRIFERRKTFGGCGLADSEAKLDFLPQIHLERRYMNVRFSGQVVCRIFIVPESRGPRPLMTFLSSQALFPQLPFLPTYGLLEQGT